MTYKIADKDILTIDRNASVLEFFGKRKTLGTGALNGGMKTDLTAVFNHNDSPRSGVFCDMRGNTMLDHQINTAKKLGLNPETVTGLNTGANIDNTAVNVVKHEHFSVTAIVTAGIDVNGCRTGDEAGLDELNGEVIVPSGTINIILYIDANLTDGCMARALMTCTQAKVVAVSELMAKSCYGSGLATGSGTDGTVIVSNSESAVYLNEAGEHFKLGHSIGKAVIAAVKDALYRQTGLCPASQHNVFRRLERFGVTPGAVWQSLQKSGERHIPREIFENYMEKMSVDGFSVSVSALYAHTLDELGWGLLREQAAYETGTRLLSLLNDHHGVPGINYEYSPGDADCCVENMISRFVDTIAHWVVSSIQH